MCAKRTVRAWLLAAVLLGGGVAWGRAPATPGAGPALDKATQAQVRKLLEERRDALRKVIEARQKEFEVGRGSLDGLLRTARKLLQAELELATTPAQRIAAHQAHYDIAKKVEEMNATRYDAGRLSFADYQESRAARLAAEIALLRAGGKPKKDAEKKAE
jgi:outer membrane protein TolC